MFSNKTDKDYEQARRSINNPYGNGVHRPEGVTVENTSNTSKFLEDLGLSKKRRKDINAARLAYQKGDQEFQRAKALDGTERRDAFPPQLSSTKKRLTTGKVRN
ncbi:MAG: hypothetical protein U0930_16140 [Pirellulales bacterium]